MVTTQRIALSSPSGPAGPDPHKNPAGPAPDF